MFRRKPCPGDETAVAGVDRLVGGTSPAWERKAKHRKKVESPSLWLARWGFMIDPEMEGLLILA